MNVSTPLQTDPGSPATSSHDYPLTYEQQGLWLRQKLSPESTVCTLSRALLLHGELDVPALQWALQALLDRHDILRTTFPIRRDEPVQHVAAHAPSQVTHEDAAEWSDERVSEYLVAETCRPFDIEHGPLLRVTALTRSAQEHILIIMLHELVADARSLTIILPELAALYMTATTGTPTSVSPDHPHFAEYAQWQSTLLASPDGERLRHFWQQNLSGAPPVLVLPLGGPRPPIPTYRGAIFTHSLGHHLTAGLKQLARSHGQTMHTVLLAAFHALLSRYTDQTDLIVGSLVDRRNNKGFADLIGPLTDSLPVRTNLSGDPSFTEVLLRVDAAMRAAHEHGNYPFTLLVEQSSPLRVPGYTPLIQAAFALFESPSPQSEQLSRLLLGLPGAGLIFGDLSLDILAVDRQAAQLDLSLNMAEADGELIASLEYSTDVFDHDSIGRLAGHFQTILASVVTDVSQPLSLLPLLTAAERAQFLKVVSNPAPATPMPEGHARFTHDYAVDMAARIPDVVAMTCDEGQLTYAELDRRANQLANYLRNIGVGPDVMVAQFMDSSLDQSISQLAIQKAGGARVTLDMSYPDERLAFILQDARPRVILTHQVLQPRLASYDAHVVVMDSEPIALAIGEQSVQAPVSDVTPGNLSGIAYTSGSTGTPKGIPRYYASDMTSPMSMLPKGTEAASLFGQRVYPGMGTGMQVMCWSFGQTVIVLSDRMRRDPADLLRRLAGEYVQVMYLHCVTLQNLGEASERTGVVPAALSQVMATGEQLRITPQVVRLFEQLSGGVLHYGYAASEVGAITNMVLMGPPSQWPALPPTGRPNPRAEVYLLDQQLQLVPLGLPGEVFVASSMMARGYYNRPDLTAERFLRHPFSDGPDALLYRTGDMARFRPDGMLEFLGRVDHQVKFRGYRVEPGEVETLLRTHDAVGDAVVMAREDTLGVRKLVAYIVPAPGRQPTVNDLRDFLTPYLPDYMIPAAFVFLDAFPLTDNDRKVNRRALPAPDPVRPGLETPYVGPRTPYEETLAAIWAEVLHLDRVGVHDNFFALGGHSLLAMRMVARVCDTLRVVVPLRRLFEAPTVAGFALTVAQAPSAPEEEPIEATRDLSPDAATEVLARLDDLSESEIDGLLDQLAKSSGDVG